MMHVLVISCDVEVVGQYDPGRGVAYVQPQDRTPHIWQAKMQSPSLCKIDGCHANTLTALFPLIVGLDGLSPELLKLGKF